MEKKYVDALKAIFTEEWIPAHRIPCDQRILWGKLAIGFNLQMALDLPAVALQDKY